MKTMSPRVDLALHGRAEGRRFLRGCQLATGDDFRGAPRREWEQILCGIQGAVDILALEDGHVDFDELPEYLAVNRDFARRYGMQSWSNLKTFDGDMPIKFLSIRGRGSSSSSGRRRMRGSAGSSHSSSPPS